MKTSTFLRTMALMTGLVFYALSGWGQTTIDFDDDAKWTGTTPLSSYAEDHTYVDGVFSATGGPALRNGTTTQDGFPGALGTYSWRLQNVTNVDWRITISSGGVSTFSVKVRRWDGSPSPDFNLEYSLDGGTGWTFVDVINNTTLDNSSDWKTFNGTINSDNSDIIIRFKANGTTERIMIDDFVWTGVTGVNLPPVITNITQTPDQDIMSSTTVSVSADVTDSDGTVELVELRWGISSGNYPNTIPMPVDIGDTFTTNSNIPAQIDGTTVYYVIYAEDEDLESSTSAEQSYEVRDARFTTLPYEETFDADLGDCYVYSVSGTTKFWNWNSGGSAQMNGFDSGDIEEDWLVLPGINLDNYVDEVMTFESWKRFGIDDANNYLKLLYSTNYNGIGDPTSATWTELTFTQPAAEQLWTSSGNIDLSGITGTEVWIAFKYNYEPGNYRWWQIDNIMIQEVAVADPDSFFAAAISPSEIGLSFATNMNGDDVVIVYNETGVFAEPAGTPPAANQPFAGGTLLYSGIMSPQSHTGLTPEETVYYKAWSYDGANYSPGLTANATTYASEPSNHVTGFTAMVNSFSSITVSWTDSDASGYLVKGSAVSFEDIAGPVDGVPESDASLVINVAAGIGSHEFTSLDPATEYFFEIYPYNGAGATINYKVDEPVPQASATTDAIPAGYLVDFEGEGETKTAYASGTVNLSGLNWDMTEALIGTTASDWKNGIRSARMRGYGTSSMTMLEKKSGGIGEVSFLYRRYGTDPQVDWKVEYSTDDSLTWTQIGADFTAPASDDVQTFSEIVNIAGDVRIRIKRATEEGASNLRLNIDDILITDFEGVPENLTVTGITLGVDDTECYDATNNITVTSTTIGSGASAEFRAGVSINFGEGFVAESGSYVLAVITDVYCSVPASLLASEDVIIPAEMPAMAANDSFFKVYPNPTSNAFTLELTEFDEALKITVEIYGMMGERLLQNELFGSQLYQFDMSTMPKGVYILRVMKGGQTEMQKIIRQ